MTVADVGPPDDAADAAGATGSVGGCSLLEVERAVEREVGASQFVPRRGGVVECVRCRSRFAAVLLCADRARRVEGESDPADMALVVPVTCAVCAVSGALVVQFGPMAGEEDGDVLAAMSRALSSVTA